MKQSITEATAEINLIWRHYQEKKTSRLLDRNHELRRLISRQKAVE
jgi:hypothetical protein